MSKVDFNNNSPASLEIGGVTPNTNTSLVNPHQEGVSKPLAYTTKSYGTLSSLDNCGISGTESMSTEEVNSPVTDNRFYNDYAAISSEPHPALAARKWLVLVLTCLLLFGNDYCYDLPGAFGAGDGVTIQSHFAEDGQVYSQKMNQALYSFYSYPNTVMTIVGGLLIDKYLGLHKTTLLFSLISVSASFVFAVGVSMANYPLMCAARLMIGCSGENLFVAQSAFVAKWFTGSNVLALAFGIAVSFSRLGGAFAYVLSPIAATMAGAPAGAYAGFVMSVMSFGATLVLLFVDHRSEQHGIVRATSGAGAGHGSGSTTTDPERGECSQPPAQQPFLLSNIKTLPRTLWVLALGSLLCYGATFSFIGVAKTFFERMYMLDSNTASFDTSLFHFLAVVLSPLIGLAVDRFGKGPLFLLFSCSGLVAVYGSLIAFPTIFSATGLMIVLSGLYSVFVAAVWSFAPFTVPDAAAGFGFGVMIAFTNLGLATSPLVVGSILDAFTGDATSPDTMLSEAFAETEGDLLPSAEGYRMVLTYLMGVAALGVANAVMLWVIDARKKNRSILMSHPAERNQLRAERDAELNELWRTKAAA